MTFFLIPPKSFTRCCGLALLLVALRWHPSNGFSCTRSRRTCGSPRHHSTNMKPLVGNNHDILSKCHSIISPSLGTTTTMVTSLASSPSPLPEDDEQQQEKDDESPSSPNPLERLNSMLDTPILDANNRSNQGPLAEALKDFVRDDPQLAQITFSGIVVVLFLILFRIYNAIKYGGF